MLTCLRDACVQMTNRWELLNGQPTRMPAGFTSPLNCMVLPCCKALGPDQPFQSHRLVHRNVVP